MGNMFSYFWQPAHTQEEVAEEITTLRDDAKLRANGLVIYLEEGENGRVIQSLAELPTGEMFITAAGGKLERTTPGQARYVTSKGDTYVLPIRTQEPPPKLSSFLIRRHNTNERTDPRENDTTKQKGRRELRNMANFGNLKQAGDLKQLGSQNDNVSGRKRASCSVDLQPPTSQALSGSVLKPSESTSSPATQRREKPPHNPEAKIEIGVTILRGRNLAIKDPEGTSDPFCHVKVKSLEAKTPIVMKTLNPVWTKDNAFRFEAQRKDVLKITCWDWDKIGTNDYMGEISIPLMTAEDVVGERWHALTGRNGGPADGTNISGELYIKLDILKK